MLLISPSNPDYNILPCKPRLPPLNTQVHKNRGAAQLQRQAILLVQVHEGLRAYWRGREHKFQIVRRHELHTLSRASVVVGGGEYRASASHVRERVPSPALRLSA